MACEQPCLYAEYLANPFGREYLSHGPNGCGAVTIGVEQNHPVGELPREIEVV